MENTLLEKRSNLLGIVAKEGPRSNGGDEAKEDFWYRTRINSSAIRGSLQSNESSITNNV